MSSTNKTTNYELSQFVGSDKPAWLTDYNQDMAKIDAGIHTAQSSATGADGKADANATNIGELSYLATTAKNNLVASINEVNSSATSAYNVASSASQTASTANTNVTNLANKFNLNTINTYEVQKTGNGTIATNRNRIKIARNSDKSICKIYGNVQINNPSNISSIKITGTGFAPTSDFTVECAGIAAINRNLYGSGEGYTIPTSLTFKTNGDIELSVPDTSTYYSEGFFSITLIPFIIFVTDFGDTPTPPLSNS